jgi:hypothetical protein
MVLHKFGQQITKVALYAMYERTLSMERQLSGRSLVYKVWRSWGCERKHFQFLIKCKETKLQFKRSLSSTSSEHDIDELFLYHFNKTAQIPKEQGKSTADVKFVSFSGEDRKTTEKTKTAKGQSSSSKSKTVFFGRFMSDLFKRSSVARTYGKRHLSNIKVKDNDQYVNSVVVHDNDTNNSQHEKCKYYWNKYYASDSETESDNSFSDTDSEDYLSFCDAEPESMNKAFMKSSRDSDSDEGIDVTSVNSIDLDTAFIDNNECTSAIYTTFDIEPENVSKLLDDSFDCEVNIYRKNVSDNAVLKELFGRTCKETVTSEDDEMDSFMRSRLGSF